MKIAEGKSTVVGWHSGELIKLSAEGARRFPVNLSGKRTENADIISLFRGVILVFC